MVLSLVHFRVKELLIILHLSFKFLNSIMLLIIIVITIIVLNLIIKLVAIVKFELNVSHDFRHIIQHTMKEKVK